LTKLDHYITLAHRKAALRYDGESRRPGQLHFSMNFDSTSFHIRANNVLQKGVWYHVAGSYDGSIMRLYLDGLEVGNLAVSGSVVTGGEHPAEFGVEIGGPILESFMGLIDEVSIYNRALTSTEIMAIYNGDIAGKCKE